jgi:hypothetical protein
MLYRLAADIVVVLHFSFILFVIIGGFLAIRWPRIAWIHLPVVAYGAIIEFFSFACVLTPLEQWLRVRSGAVGYDTSFTEHYILPLVYPSVLTYRLQVFLGILVIVINVIAYMLVLRKRRIRHRQSEVLS